jgi:NAD(P)-dependent dehydrogenase (short-subunit alcohol dehydrogenase family)
VLLAGKIAIVSGVGPGIGRSIALTLAREGADIALGSLREENLTGVAAEIEALGRRVVWMAADVTESSACRRLADAACAEFGRIDVLVNNAFSARPVVQFADSRLDDWRPAMEINYFGSLAMTQAVVPFMRALGDGRIVMINASAMRIAGEGYGPYAGSKAALLGATRVLAKELGHWGIRVNSVVPSATDTPSMRRSAEDQATERAVDPEVVWQELAASNALGYVPTADEVAAAVLFFASPLSSAVTGQFLHVNAGFWLE